MCSGSRIGKAPKFISNESKNCWFMANEKKRDEFQHQNHLKKVLLFSLHLIYAPQFTFFIDRLLFFFFGYKIDWLILVWLFIFNLVSTLRKAKNRVPFIECIKIHFGVYLADILNFKQNKNGQVIFHIANKKGRSLARSHKKLISC